MVELFPPLVPVPVRIVAQQFDVQAIQSPSGLDIEGVLADLPNGRDPSKLQEVTKVVSQFLELANQGALPNSGIPREPYCRRLLARTWLCVCLRQDYPPNASAGQQHGVWATRRARGDVNVISLKYGMNSVACHVRLVRRVLSDAAQSLKGRRLVAERLQESVRELSRVERLFDQLTDCFFDLDRVQPFAPSIG